VIENFAFLAFGRERSRQKIFRWKSVEAETLARNKTEARRKVGLAEQDATICAARFK